MAQWLPPVMGAEEPVLEGLEDGVALDWGAAAAVEVGGGAMYVEVLLDGGGTT